MEPNPKGNELKAGLTDEELLKAISSSGYPLQHRIALMLKSEFQLAEEWGYSDRDSNEPRSLDLMARRRITSDPGRPVQLSVALLIECKRSDLPIVFFQAAVPRVPRNYPKVFGFGRHGFSLTSGRESQELRFSDVLRMEDFPWISQALPVCRSMARVERHPKPLLSGDFPFREAVLPLVNAIDHWDSIHQWEGGGPRAFPVATFLVSVLDAPMVIAHGPPESLKAEMAPWVRVVRQESAKGEHGVTYRNYVVDFVHVEFFPDFIKGHLLPFAASLAERIAEGEVMLLRGNGIVSSLDNWTWTELVKSLPA